MCMRERSTASPWYDVVYTHVFSRLDLPDVCGACQRSTVSWSTITSPHGIRRPLPYSSVNPSSFAVCPWAWGRGYRVSYIIHHITICIVFRFLVARLLVIGNRRPGPIDKISSRVRRVTRPGPADYYFARRTRITDMLVPISTCRSFFFSLSAIRFFFRFFTYIRFFPKSSVLYHLPSL